MKKWIGLLFLAIGACSWRSPDSEFYMMNSQGLSQLSERKMSVAVAKIKVPDLLDRQQMVVYESKSGQIEIMEFNRWGEVLPDVLQSTVINDLIAYLPNAYVKRTYFDSQNVNYSVNIEINNLQAYKGDKVILTAWWTITSSTGRTLLRKQSSYETSVAGKSIQDLVNAQNQAVHNLSRDIAEHLQKL